MINKNKMVKEERNWAEQMLEDIKNEISLQEEYRNKEWTPIKKLYEDMVAGEKFVSVEYSDAEWGSVEVHKVYTMEYIPQNDFTVYWDGPQKNTFKAGSLEGGEWYTDLTIVEAYELLDKFAKNK